MYWKARPEYSLYSYVCTESHVQNSCKQAPFRLFTSHLHHLSLRRCVCLSWPVRFLSSLPSLLSTVSINHQLLPGLRLILTIWRFYYWKIDQKSAKNIVLRQYFLSVISLPLSLLCSWQCTLGDISLAMRLLLANSSNTVSPPQSSLAQICSVFSRHFQNSIKNSNNREGLGFSPDLIKLNKSRCPYFSCEIKTIHRRKNNVEERLPQEVHN